MIIIQSSTDDNGKRSIIGVVAPPPNMTLPVAMDAIYPLWLEWQHTDTDEEDELPVEGDRDFVNWLLQKKGWTEVTESFIWSMPE